MGRQAKHLDMREVFLRTVQSNYLDKREVALLASVPRRGTAAWERRETLRETCGMCCISHGDLPARGPDDWDRGEF